MTLTPEAAERLLGKLRYEPNEFKQDTYRALSAGTANSHQQRAAASGIALTNGLNAEVSRALTAALSDLTTLRARESTWRQAAIDALNGNRRALTDLVNSLEKDRVSEGANHPKT